ncbi:putative glycosyltransferase family 21 protein [Diaporthe ampelina]|uniref:Ceramide glucosyltransferase n=1 Tax=Diaporthe ampelina TaxID=1214573 RepID=A0A0G2FXW5_9PEZI|nr:putative glycosyltransferase family 21 protein [Diaporthe ampelina]
MALLSNIAVYAAYPALIWSSVVYLVQSIGIFQIFRGYSRPPLKPVSPTLSAHLLPHITIIRPVKGLEPQLYECLASTFLQTYPRSKLTINLCVSSEDDPAYPVLEKIVDDFGGSDGEGYDIRLLVEEYDPQISGLDGNELGPNPKIRNISRAYREAPADSLIWIMDCNVWISKDVAGRMVDKLMGFLPGGRTTTPYKLVHQLPLVVDIPPADEGSKNNKNLTPGGQNQAGLVSRAWHQGGGRLDEMFMATTHAKFYSAINTVGVAPCVIGKSNMFRKAHLDTYTQPSHNPHLSPSDAGRGTGVDFFSSYICEDHLISDLLWNAPIPPDNTTATANTPPRPYGNHAVVPGDLAIQPVARVPVPAYWARRVRWLRVRKWTVLLATLVEPGVESLLCNLYFAYAATTLPAFHTAFGVPQTWLATASLWAAGVAAWMACDRAVHARLHSCACVEPDPGGHTPFFARGTATTRRGFLEWLPAWLGRELLALPIWTWAVLLGTTVTWRGKSFHVRSDMSVVAIDGAKGSGCGSLETDGSTEDDKTWEVEHDDMVDPKSL